VATDATVERVGLGAVAGLTHRRLSAGQRRRLALGAAIVRDPGLLLLDEPHAGLDADGREVLHEIVAAAPGEGRTVVIASHELELARVLATREVRVEAGRTQPAPAGAARPGGPRAEMSA
jgi:ABC-type multidrug transport system ATPase subunit